MAGIYNYSKLTHFIDLDYGPLHQEVRELEESDINNRIKQFLTTNQCIRYAITNFMLGVLKLPKTFFAPNIAVRKKIKIKSI